METWERRLTRTRVIFRSPALKERTDSEEAEEGEFSFETPRRRNAREMPKTEEEDPQVLERREEGGSRTPETSACQLIKDLTFNQSLHQDLLPLEEDLVQHRLGTWSSAELLSERRKGAVAVLREAGVGVAARLETGPTPGHRAVPRRVVKRCGDGPWAGV
ncbi:hypothetical protein NDU88_005857 [Pleurodeles waltl]|uniref:Uncharacterized protein n=1 Tax=Pleurodeles waltl TaxID=8319 RepID=A0AAV7PH32_PLEWA|nr:hypothetical protein NDU88_005857 [Pleurodeles waltl]